MVKSEDAFIKEVTSEIFHKDSKTRILHIKGFSADRTLIRFKANDGRVYQTDIDNFVEHNQILIRFNVNLN